MFKLPKYWEPIAPWFRRSCKIYRENIHSSSTEKSVYSVVFLVYSMFFLVANRCHLSQQVVLTVVSWWAANIAKFYWFLEIRNLVVNHQINVMHGFF